MRAYRTIEAAEQAAREAASRGKGPFSVIAVGDRFCIVQQGQEFGAPVVAYV